MGEVPIVVICLPQRSKSALVAFNQRIAERFVYVGVQRPARLSRSYRLLPAVALNAVKAGAGFQQFTESGAPALRCLLPDCVAVRKGGAQTCPACSSVGNMRN